MLALLLQELMLIIHQSTIDKILELQEMGLLVPKVHSKIVRTQQETIIRLDPPQLLATQKAMQSERRARREQILCNKKRRRRQHLTLGEQVHAQIHLN